MRGISPTHTPWCCLMLIVLLADLLPRLLHLLVEGTRHVVEAEVEDGAAEAALLAEAILDLLGCLKGVDLVRDLDVRRVRLATPLQRLDRHLHSALTVVTVVEPRVELVTREIHLHDPPLEVVEVGGLLEDLLGFGTSHRLGLVLHEAHALRSRSVVERGKHVALVETSQGNHRFALLCDWN